MGQILEGYYTQNGVTFHVRERGERTFIEMQGEEFEFNANGYIQEPLTEEGYADALKLDPDAPAPDLADMDTGQDSFKSTFKDDQGGSEFD